jgi:hypothetical protein
MGFAWKSSMGFLPKGKRGAPPPVPDTEFGPESLEPHFKHVETRVDDAAAPLRLGSAMGRRRAEDSE